MFKYRNKYIEQKLISLIVNDNNKLKDHEILLGYKKNDCYLKPSILKLHDSSTIVLNKSLYSILALYLKKSGDNTLIFSRTQLPYEFENLRHINSSSHMDKLMVDIEKEVGLRSKLITKYKVKNLKELERQFKIKLNRIFIIMNDDISEYVKIKLSQLAYSSGSFGIYFVFKKKNSLEQQIDILPLIPFGKMTNLIKKRMNKFSRKLINKDFNIDDYPKNIKWE